MDIPPTINWNILDFLAGLAIGLLFREISRIDWVSNFLINISGLIGLRSISKSIIGLIENIRDLNRKKDSNNDPNTDIDVETGDNAEVTIEIYRDQVRTDANEKKKAVNKKYNIIDNTDQTNARIDQVTSKPERQSDETE